MHNQNFLQKRLSKTERDHFTFYTYDSAIQNKNTLSKTLAKSLSGGNIQKSFWHVNYHVNPVQLLLHNPRGLDIGAAEYVREQLISQRNDGTAVLLISEDLDEIFALSDRIAVIYEGKIMGILDRDQATREKVGLLMAGIREEDHQDVPL